MSLCISIHTDELRFIVKSWTLDWIGGTLGSESAVDRFVR